ncbi:MULTISPECIES: hypothetical protein [Streptomyces]|uniref:Antitoxin Phd n=2 Tax=Streptomyces TaxID=1883 RepID=A0A1Z2LAR7_9ACTN|nr:MULTISPECIES: hypothetical protein [Streptomyces]ARZ71384.1 hypothetical protein SMD11_5808 [Streptomyces albireticuli]MBB5121962.1 Xaa-Pro aminopeptidase [Streptomyces eurocidicus]MBF6051528.1 hypothetical protein [Streptomyces eurocidicus]MCD9145431.1 hypothetical protein [Streptomyces albireticuli]MCD9165004.1 hypothetical protein [Streptomyces albireticuli]
MPALNIEFTEEELAAIREAAAADGKSIKAYVHDLSVREQQRRRFVERAAKFWNEHIEEFDAAFPEEAPTSEGGAAA